MSIKVIVDSGSSIKLNEREKYDVDVLPLKILLNNKEYLDGENLSMEVFYNELINNHQFPKTSLPSLDNAENLVNKYLSEGHDVIIITISSGISGTFNALNMLFSDQEKVRVIDSKTAVGGIKILVNEINKYRNESLDFVCNKINELIPRIRVYAVPETLAYLHKGGRLSTATYAAGTVLKIKPIIELREKVGVANIAIGLKKAMKIIAAKLESCDENYPIVPSFTYNDSNLDGLISLVDEKYKKAMIDKDNLDPAIACHWGPNAFGFIYVEKEK